MSFIEEVTNNKMYHPGFFLASEECERKTYQMNQANAETDANGGKYIPMGTVYPADDATAIGIVYEDVDVTSGDMPGSVVLSGTVWEDRITISADAKSALEGKGFKFLTEPAVMRP